RRRALPLLGGRRALVAVAAGGWSARDRRRPRVRPRPGRDPALRRRRRPREVSAVLLLQLSQPAARRCPPPRRSRATRMGPAQSRARAARRPAGRPPPAAPPLAQRPAGDPRDRQRPARAAVRPASLRTASSTAVR